MWFAWTLLNGAQSPIQAMDPPTAQEEKNSFDGAMTWMGPYMLFDFKLRIWCDGMHP